MADLAERIRRTVERANSVTAPAEEAAALRDAWSRAITDPTLRLANASCYLDAFGHVIVAWLWLDMAINAASKLEAADDAFYRGKLAACRYFYRWELPRIDRWLGLLDPVDRTPLDATDDCFA